MDWSGLLDDMTGAVRDTFGETVRYFVDPSEDPAAPPIDIVAPYDPDHVPLNPAGGVRVGGSVEVVDIRIADIGREPSTDDEVEVRGRRYKIAAKEPSSSGMWKCHLRRRG